MEAQASTAAANHRSDALQRGIHRNLRWCRADVLSVPSDNQLRQNLDRLPSMGNQLSGALRRDSKHARTQHPQHLTNEADLRLPPSNKAVLQPLRPEIPWLDLALAHACLHPTKLLHELAPTVSSPGRVRRNAVAAPTYVEGRR